MYQLYHLDINRESYISKTFKSIWVKVNVFTNFSERCNERNKLRKNQWKDQNCKWPFSTNQLVIVIYQY